MVVEGAGGWHAPLNDSETMADSGRALDLPVVLVVGLRGSVASTTRLLTAQAIAARGLGSPAGSAITSSRTFAYAAENIATLESRLAAPLLDVVVFQCARRPGPALAPIAVTRLKEVLRL